MKNANRDVNGQGPIVFKDAKLLFEEVWTYAIMAQTKRNEKNDVYTERNRMRSADDTIKRLQGEIGKLKQEHHVP